MSCLSCCLIFRQTCIRGAYWSVAAPACSPHPSLVPETHPPPPDALQVTTINSDDPAYFGGYLTDNYIWLADTLRLSLTQVTV